MGAIVLSSQRVEARRRMTISPAWRRVGSCLVRSPGRRAWPYRVVGYIGRIVVQHQHLSIHEAIIGQRSARAIEVDDLDRSGRSEGQQVAIGKASEDGICHGRIEGEPFWTRREATIAMCVVQVGMRRDCAGSDRVADGIEGIGPLLEQRESRVEDQRRWRGEVERRAAFAFGDGQDLLQLFRAGWRGMMA